jgi:hypothetical protein
MSGKTFKIGIVVLLLVIAAIILLILKRGKTSEVPANVNQSANSGNLEFNPERDLKPFDSGAVPVGNKIVMQTATGAITVNNFYIEAKQGDDGTAILRQTDDYFISYMPTDGSFWIALIGSQIELIRPAAEKDFLSILGISQRDACRLSVVVGPPYRGPDRPARFSPLSFCAGT